MLITTIEHYVNVVPTAAGSEYDALRPHLETTENMVISNLIGQDLYNHIAALSDTNALKSDLTLLIATKAYGLSIPFLDLVQTPNGFAVVSNTNLAPASKERVERLIQKCNETVDSVTDLLFQRVMETPTALTEWKKSKRFNNLTNCFFVTGIDFSYYADTSGSRADFLKAKSDLLTAQQNELTKTLSFDYVKALITANRNNSLSEKDAYVVDVCKLALVKFREKNTAEAQELLRGLIVMIENDIDSYPIYKSSAEYALKTSANYVNQQGDSTYFFG